MSSPFDKAWDVIKQPQPQFRPEHIPEYHEFTMDYQYDPSTDQYTDQTQGEGDDCCEAAREQTIDALSASFRRMARPALDAGSWNQHNERATNAILEYQHASCEELRERLQFMSNPETIPDFSGHEVSQIVMDMNNTAQRILQEWEQCEGQQGGGYQPSFITGYQ